MNPHTVDIALTIAVVGLMTTVLYLYRVVRTLMADNEIARFRCQTLEQDINELSTQQEYLHGRMGIIPTAFQAGQLGQRIQKQQQQLVNLEGKFTDVFERVRMLEISQNGWSNTDESFDK